MFQKTCKSENDFYTIIKIIFRDIKVLTIHILVQFFLYSINIDLR